MLSVLSSGRWAEPKAIPARSLAVPRLVTWTEVTAKNPPPNRSKHGLAALIRQRWEDAGYEVQVWVEANGEIRSNLVNGLPPGDAKAVRQ